jgi:hypothetical protein
MKLSTPGRLGLEGSARSPPIVSGRSPGWLKMKNAAAPAVKREAEGIGANRNGDDGGWQK